MEFQHKISFCIVCMNRLYQLQKTLLQNIKDNEEYDNVEFVVLNYNSKDGMEEWIKENFLDHINTGKMVYYKTTDPEKFSHSHSKNLAFKLAEGDIVCNINADNYTGIGFAAFIDQAFKNNSNIVLTCDDFYKTKKNYDPPHDVVGRVCVKKRDFLNVKGFDERMKDYGFEDCDFVNRIEFSGVKRALIEDFSFLKHLKHTNEERYPFHLLMQQIGRIYVHYISPWSSSVLFLWKDSSFQSGTWIENRARWADLPSNSYSSDTLKHEIGRLEDEWITGKWNEQEGLVKIQSESSSINFLMKDDGNLIKKSNDNKQSIEYFLIQDEAVIKECIYFNFFYTNWAILEKNLENKVIKVNPAGFGKAHIHKNFSEHENYAE